jgi:hypothetical protein
VGLACEGLDADELNEEIQQVTEELTQARAAGQGLSTALVFDLTDPARVPRRPVQSGRNSMVLAGGLIGLIIGAWGVGTRLPARLARRVRRGA